MHARSQRLPGRSEGLPGRLADRACPHARCVGCSCGAFRASRHRRARHAKRGVCLHAHFACAAGGESRGCEPGMRTGGEQQRATVICSFGTSHASLLRHTKWGVCEHDWTRTLVWVPHACISRIHMPCVRTLDALFRERETWSKVYRLRGRGRIMPLVGDIYYHSQPGHGSTGPYSMGAV